MKICERCGKRYQDSMAFCPNDGQMLSQYTPLTSSDQDPLIGMLIEKKYHIEHKIAQGGMSNIYLATHVQLDLPVAVKVMHERLVRDANAIRRFRREAQSAMQIRHTNAITVMDFGVTESNIVYLVMEYLQGMTLREKLKKQRLLPLPEVLRIMQQVCAAVQVAHRRGIVHRDLKPDNIFLERDGENEVVKVLDFGIAKLELLKASPELHPDFQLTRAGTALGSPQYMSPEQCGEEPIDARSDVYSLGVMLYELLTGSLPFNGPNATALAFKHMTERPRSLIELRPDLPPTLDAVVLRILEKDRSLRPPDAGALAEELTQAFADILAPTPNVEPQTNKRLLQSSGAFSLAVLSDATDWPTLNLPSALSDFPLNYPLDSIFLPEVFGLLARDRVSGTAWFSSDLTIKGVYWREGKITFAVSNDLTERFGERLVRQGRLHRKQLNAAIRWKNEQQVSIIDAFIALEYFTWETLIPLLKPHVYSICYSILDWEDGTYAFETSPVDLPAVVSLPAGELVMEAIRSIIDLGRIKAFLGPPDQSWLVLDKELAWDQITLRPDEATILNELQTVQSISQVLASLDLPEEQILRTLCGLLALGAVQRVEQEEDEEEEEPPPITSVESIALFCYEVENMLSQVTRQNTDYYAILGIARQASIEEIEAAYYHLRERFNPKRFQDITTQMPTLAGDLQTINTKLIEAYAKLSDPNERIRYTQQLRRESGRWTVPESAKQASAPATPIEISKPPVMPSAPVVSRMAAPVASTTPTPQKPPQKPSQKAPQKPLEVKEVKKEVKENVKVATPSAAMPPPPMAFSDPSRLRNADDWYLFGLDLLERGDAEKAVRAFHNALKRRPRDAEFHAALARAYAELYGYNKQTIQEFQEAITLQPKSADYPAELALFLLKHNQQEMAAEHINMALGLDANSRIARKAKELLEQQSKK
ncbi:MAG: protein kinase [Acidobacteriota bacterium]